MNARSHVVGILRVLIDTENSWLSSWLVRSPDVLPIENVWSMVAERLARRHAPVATVDELWHRVETAWAPVPVYAIRFLLYSMPRRISAVITARGGCSGTARRVIQNDAIVQLVNHGNRNHQKVRRCPEAHCTSLPRTNVRSLPNGARLGSDDQASLITLRSWSCQVIYSQFGLAIHQNDHQARRRFVEWAQNEIAVVPDFHKRILFSDKAHFWLNGYVNKQNCRIWSEANPQVYVETPLHPGKLSVWCALWAGGILLQKR
ncbi:hypothetical protein TNCV_898741 [Trichonephila clavipes]|nr:hypothetical protein TNCV_898741 [Trichonephila clavipes]